MNKCFFCKNKYIKEDLLYKFSCEHCLCANCLCRSLLINNFIGINTNNMEIKFKCICNNDNNIIIKSISDYITILNKQINTNELISNKTINKNYDDNSINLLNNNILNIIKNKKNNLKYLNFEDFSSYINNVESNLMKLFKTESENTINEFDSLINELKELRYKFISSLDLKMVKINSMFVIIKMVFYLMYKDYNNYNSLNNNLMIYLARLDIEFDKIKFFPNLQDLTEIKNNLKNFEKNLNSNKIFNVDYIFKKYENKTEIDWKLIKKINLNKKTKFNLITSILQLNNNLNKLLISNSNGYIDFYDIKNKILLNKETINLSNYLKNENIFIRKIIKSLNDNEIYINAGNCIIQFNINKKEIINIFKENEGNNIICLCENIILNFLFYSTNLKEIKVISNNLIKDNLLIHKFNSLCHCIYYGRNYKIYFGLDNGEIYEFYYKNYFNKNNYNNKNNDINNNNNNISLFYIFDEQTIINDIIENKNKLIVALNNSEINIIDIKDKNINKLLGHSKSVLFVKYYDINTIVSSSIDSEIRIWNINKLLCTYVIKDYENDEGWILSLLRINNGLIFCGYSNGFFKVYNYE